MSESHQDFLLVPIRTSLEEKAPNCGGSHCPLPRYRFGVGLRPRHLGALPPSAVPTTTRGARDPRGKEVEGAAHRRQRRKRGDARALLRIVAAQELLAAHHSAMSNRSSVGDKLDLAVPDIEL